MRAFAPLLMAVALVGAPSRAQGVAETDIVVRGLGSDAGDVQSRSYDLVRAVTARTVADQVPRLTEPLCLRILGVSERTETRVRATIETVAINAGIGLGRMGCDANVMVTFTADADALAQATAQAQPMLMRTMAATERAALLEGAGPLRWWLRRSVTSTRGSRPGSTSAALMNSGDYRMNTDAPTTNEYVSSMIRRPVQAAIDGVAIVVDVPAAQGLPLDALAEYIAFVALAPPRMTDDFSAFDSVLALRGHTAGSTSTRRLSDWDRAFLAALYAAPADRSAAAQRSLIAQGMAERLVPR